MTCKNHPDAPHGFVRGASHSEDRYVCECEFWEEPKMNELVQRLKLQAGINDNPDQEGLDLFAELIIRECAGFADEHNDFSEGVTLGVGRALKEHFGVEEK